jgi:uncharacterized membrane protein YfhO
MGAILLTALILILAADIFIISHPISGYIHSRSMSDAKISYWNVTIGMLLPLVIAGLYRLIRQKKKETADR